MIAVNGKHRQTDINIFVLEISLVLLAIETHLNFELFRPEDVLLENVHASENALSRGVYFIEQISSQKNEIYMFGLSLLHNLLEGLKRVTVPYRVILFMS